MKVKYFGAEHCGMCKCLRPRVESWCKENNVEFEHCDTDDDKYASELAEHGIRSIPAVVLIDGDKACTIRGIDEWNVFAESWGGNKR